MKKKYPNDYDFCPKSQILPTDHYKFQMDQGASSKEQLWIFKPSNQGCGRGIKIINNQTKLRNEENHIISEYILDPHLIDGFKYDLRI